MLNKENIPFNFNIADLNRLSPKKGRLLISAPFLGDQNFNRSVILLINYEEKGTLGLVLNKPLNLTLNDTLKNFPDFNSNVYVGGPVDIGKLFYLHTLGDRLNDSLEIIDGLYWGGDFKQLKSLIKTNAIEEDEIRFFIGYAGWDFEQLNEEVAAGDWVVSDCSIEDVMSACQDEECWKKLLSNMGEMFSIMANFPTDPALN